MQGLALKEEADLQEPELKKTNPVFEKSSLSTKVKLKPNLYKSLSQTIPCFTQLSSSWHGTKPEKAFVVKLMHFRPLP